MDNVVSITNRNAGYTGYTIPEMNLTRSFMPKETKKVPLNELKQLQFVDGGEYLLKHCFIINDTDALAALNMDNVEPEYFYTEAEVTELLENGTLEQLEDCLNFAPEGVIELVKDIAVKIEVPDTRKRKMISEKTGLNIDSAIKINELMATDTEENEEVEGKTRKAAPITAKANSTVERKAATPVRKYNVVKK